MSPDQISHFSNTNLMAKVHTETSNSEAVSIVMVALKTHWRTAGMVKCKMRIFEAQTRKDQKQFNKCDSMGTKD